MRISLRPLVPGSYLFGVGLPEEFLCGFFLGVDFWIYFRVQRFLVRQWIHVFFQFTEAFVLGSCDRFSSCSPVLCLPRRVQDLDLVPRSCRQRHCMLGLGFAGVDALCAMFPSFVSANFMFLYVNMWITDPEVDSRLSGHVLWPLKSDSLLYGVRCSPLEYMLGSTADSCSCVRLRRLWCGCDIGSGMCKAGLLVTSHPALCSLPRWQVHEARHHGLYAQKDSHALGSGTYKAGIAGDNAPRAVFSTLVRRRMMLCIMSVMTSLSCCRGRSSWSRLFCRVSPVAVRFRLSMPLLCRSSRFTSLS